MINSELVKRWKISGQQKKVRGHGQWRIVPASREKEVLTFASLIGAVPDREYWWDMMEDSVFDAAYILLPTTDGDNSRGLAPKGPWLINMDVLIYWESGRKWEDWNDRAWGEYR